MLSHRSALIAAAATLVFLIVLFDQPAGTEADHGYGHGHGHGHGASGTACIVKGSYCSCHYCKCEKGHIHCGKHGGYGERAKYYSMKLFSFSTRPRFMLDFQLINTYNVKLKECLFFFLLGSEVKALILPILRPGPYCQICVANCQVSVLTCLLSCPLFFLLNSI